MRHLAVSALLCSLFLTACGGGGGGGAAAVPQGASTPGTAQLATVTFTLAIPGRTPGKKGRLPLYISSAVTSATIHYTPDGGTSGTVTATCTTTCAATFSAPVGVDRFDITLFDVHANALSRGSTTSVVSPGGSNAISMTFDGIVHDATLRIVPASLPAGTAATALMFIDAHDADGATIVPDGQYVDANGTPVLFTIANAATGGAISFSSSGVTAPGTVLPVAYDGTASLGTSFTLGTTSSLPGTVTGATLTVVPTTVYTYPYDAPYPYGHNITTDGAGNFYAYADDFPLQLAGEKRAPRTLRRPASVRRPASGRKISTGPSPGAGAIFACCAGNRAAALASSDGIADLVYSAANGGMLFTDDGPSLVGYQLLGGQLSVALPDPDELVQRLAAGTDGNVYYTARNSTANVDYVGYADASLTSVTQVQLTTPNAAPAGIAFANGSAYFTESGAATIGVLTPAAGANPAAVREFAMPNANDVPLEITNNPFGKSVFILGYASGDPTQATVWKAAYAGSHATVTATNLPSQTCGCGFARLHATADAIWTINLENGELVHIDLPTKAVTEFPVVSTTNVFAEDFTFAPDGTTIMYVGTNVNGVGKLIW